MNASGSVILTLLDRIRAMLDEPDKAGKYTNEFILRHYIMTSLVDVLARVGMNSTCKVVVKHEISLDTDVKRYSLPACVGQVMRIAGEDSNGVVTSDWVPRDLLDVRGPGYRLEGAGESLDLVWDPVVPSGLTTVRVWYVPNGDVLCHYSANGGVATQVSFTGATWDEATLTLTKVGGFASYEWREGDKLTITAVTSGTVGVYAVTERVDDDSIVLATSPGASASAIAGRLWVWEMTLEASPDLGGLDRRENGYLGQTLRVLHASPLPVYGRQIASQSVTPAGVWSIETHLPFDAGASPSAIPYEVAPAGVQGLVEAIAMRTALKLSVVRRWSQTIRRGLEVEYLSALKTIGDQLGYVEARAGKKFPRTTVDNPNQVASLRTAGMIDYGA